MTQTKDFLTITLLVLTTCTVLTAACLNNPVAVYGVGIHNDGSAFSQLAP